MLHSDTALAAVGVTLPLLLIMVSVENIFSAGAAVLAGRQLGAKGPGGGQHYGDDHRRPVGSHRYDSLCQRTLLYGAAAPFPSAPRTRFCPRLRTTRSGCLSPRWPICRPKAELCRQGGIFRQNFFHSRHLRRRPKCGSGPLFHVRLGLGYGRAGELSLATTVSQFVTFSILLWFYLGGRSIIKNPSRTILSPTFT